jgi:hypothetical protein
MSDSESADLPPLEPIFATAAERAVFASLTDEEVAVLVAVRKRLNEVAGDVEAHLMGATFW